MKLLPFVAFKAALLVSCSHVILAVDCELMTPPVAPMEMSLVGMSSVLFEGFKPVISRVEGPPMIKIMQYSTEPSMEERDGKLVVSSGGCSIQEGITTIAPTSEEEGISPQEDHQQQEVEDEDVVVGEEEEEKEEEEEEAEEGASGASAGLPSSRLASMSYAAGATAFVSLMDGGMAAASIAGLAAWSLPGAVAQEELSCEQVVEVEIHGPVKSPGAVYMEDMLLWEDYDDSPNSKHFRDHLGDWPERVNASRNFRNSPSGSAYNYRNKVLMGMAQTTVLNEPPEVTPKDAVDFQIPENVALPDTDEGIMMLSVLEMQSLLRSGALTSTQLTTVALNMLEMYDPEYNMLEVELRDLALRVAAEADVQLAAGNVTSFIHGIPFAIKDTYDVAGYATAYGSFEFMDNIVETESPLVTYAVQNYGVPLFKSSVPQMTWGTNNWKGTVYSCLNGGYAAGTLNSGGSSIGSGAAVCLGVVPVAICEQTGSSCQAPAIANGISTLIPSLGTFSRENNGLYSLESDRPGLLCRDILSCAVFYNYMRGTSPGDGQSRDVPFSDPSQEDISSYTIAFVDNSDTAAWPHAWDTPFMGQRNVVVEALESLGATVNVYDDLSEIMTPNQLYTDIVEAGISNTQGFDWYWLNVEGFFEQVFLYGREDSVTYGPVWRRQNNNFDGGSPHVTHIGATAYGYLDSMFLFGYGAEMGAYPMMQEQMPDAVVHFGQSELAGAYNTNLIKRAGINTVHIPQFYWNTTNTTWADWEGSRPIDYYEETTVSAAMITCESKKYEPIKALAVCYQLQQALVPGGKLISPHIQQIQEAIASGNHDLDCPYDWSDFKDDYMVNYPADLREKVMAKLTNIGSSRVCQVEE